MALEAKGLVLMNSINGVLSNELGSYEIIEGLELVYKAYVSEGYVKLYVTTARDVTDEEYNDVYDEYESEFLSEEGFEVEEIEDEYNPVWSITFPFKEDYDDMNEDLNYVISYHKKEMDRIFEERKS
jgi:hypothetical protein